MEEVEPGRYENPKAFTFAEVRGIDIVELRFAVMVLKSAGSAHWYIRFSLISAPTSQSLPFM